MKEYNWENDDDEYVKDEITMALLVIEKTQEDSTIAYKTKQSIIDECLDKLNSLYNEQRKRGTFKRNSRTT